MWNFHIFFSFLCQVYHSLISFKFGLWINCIEQTQPILTTKLLLRAKFGDLVSPADVGKPPPALVEGFPLDTMCTALKSFVTIFWQNWQYFDFGKPFSQSSVPEWYFTMQEWIHIVKNAFQCSVGYVTKSSSLSNGTKTKKLQAINYEICFDIGTFWAEFMHPWKI